MLVIREARPEDAGALAELMDVLGYPTDAESMRLRMRELADEGSYRTWVAEEDGVVQGEITCRRGFSTARGGREVEIASLAVRRERQGRGVGSRLLREGERWAAEQGATACRLSSRAEREAAHRFYAERGYVVTGVRFRKPLPRQP